MELSQLLSKQTATPLDAATGQQANAADASQHELEAAAKSFEAIFVKQILKQLQETIENASFDPDDKSNQQVHGMYCTFLGDMIAQEGGFGLWEDIYGQMAQMNNVPTPPIDAGLDAKL